MMFLKVFSMAVTMMIAGSDIVHASSSKDIGIDEESTKGTKSTKSTKSSKSKTGSKWVSSGNIKTGNKKGASGCAENEEYVTCRSSSCFDKTCADIVNKKVDKYCTEDCKAGCACKDGYVRQEDGFCYPQDTCFGGVRRRRQ